MNSQRIEHRRKKNGAVDLQSSVPPRLLDVPRAAVYLNISPSLVREYISAGMLHQVLLPDPNCSARVIRRVLLDIRELDRFVDQCLTKMQVEK